MRWKIIIRMGFDWQTKVKRLGYARACNLLVMVTEINERSKAPPIGTLSGFTPKGIDIISCN
jgi:hypothetical protein